jgi:glucosamine--fructose-6-phosphate aminotransferase (isomerizing)
MLNDHPYSQYALVREMLETPEIIRNFDLDQAQAVQHSLAETGRVLFTGEGSSRIFPAKHCIAQALRQGAVLTAAAEGSRQAAEYDLSAQTVIAGSNSGKTREVVSLFRALQAQGHAHLFSLCAFAGSPLGAASKEAYVLSCGPEAAVAATKSVLEQALFYHSILERVLGSGALAAGLGALADATQEAMTQSIAPTIVEALAHARTLFWSGRNDGVAEELTLKTNEITRKASAFLEGTYAVHGIEEVMTAEDAVIIVNPFEAEEEKFYEVLVAGVGCTVVAIASRQTRFPTILIPSVRQLDAYVQLAAGWNLLVEIGMRLDINMDKPVRARKVGNELAWQPR